MRRNARIFGLEIKALPENGETVQRANLPVPLACNALRLMGAQLRLRLTAYAP